MCIDHTPADWEPFPFYFTQRDCSLIGIKTCRSWKGRKKMFVSSLNLPKMFSAVVMQQLTWGESHWWTQRKNILSGSTSTFYNIPDSQRITWNSGLIIINIQISPQCTFVTVKEYVVQFGFCNMHVYECV